MIRNRLPGSHSMRSIRPRSRTVVPAAAISSGSSVESGGSSLPAHVPPNATSNSRCGNVPGSAISFSSHRARSSTISVRSRFHVIGAPARPAASTSSRTRSAIARSCAWSVGAFARAEVVGCVSGEELLENVVDHVASGERVELDDRLGLVEWPRAQEPVEEEAVGARRVRLEHGRAEGRRLVEPSADRRDRVRVLEYPVECGELACGPPCAPVLVGSAGDRGELVEESRPEPLVELDQSRCRAPAR